MTFSVMLKEQDVPKRQLGTIWASEEGQAAAMARELFGERRENVVVKKAEDREIPFSLPG